MRLIRPILISALVVLWAGPASASLDTVTFTHDLTEAAGGSFPSTQTITPTQPFGVTPGVDGFAGRVDEAAGTFDLNLPPFTIVIDVSGDPNTDAQLDITGWRQQGSFAGGGGGPVAINTGGSASGNTVCTPLLGPFGAAVCGAIVPEVAAWPPSGGDASPPFGAAGATIDITTNTIVVTEPHSTLGGQIRNTYSYVSTGTVPLLSTWQKLGLGLLLLTTMIVTIRRVRYST